MTPGVLSLSAGGCGFVDESVNRWSVIGPCSPECKPERAVGADHKVAAELQRVVGGSARRSESLFSIQL